MKDKYPLWLLMVISVFGLIVIVWSSNSILKSMGYLITLIVSYQAGVLEFKQKLRGLSVQEIEKEISLE